MTLLLKVVLRALQDRCKEFVPMTTYPEYMDYIYGTYNGCRIYIRHVNDTVVIGYNRHVRRVSQNHPDLYGQIINELEDITRISK